MGDIVPLYERGCHEVTGDFLFRVKGKIVKKEHQQVMFFSFFTPKNTETNNPAFELNKKDLIYIYQSI